MSGKFVQRDAFIAPGTAVRLQVHGREEWEEGVVIHCWLDDNLGFYDCYVAFFGQTRPEGKPVETPYVLRYASVSLKVASDED